MLIIFILSKLQAYFRFFIGKRFIIHLILALITAFVLSWLSLKYLDSYTNHGQKISIPDLYGTQADELESYLKPLGFRYEIVDSVHADNIAAGSVISQSPKPTALTGQYAKDNRKIYVTVVAKMPKLVTVPCLVHKSKRHAEGILKIIGLKAKYTYKPYNDCRDCVIAQKYKGKDVACGDKIQKGQTIEVVLGQGKGGEAQIVPDLNGLTIEQAISRLNSVSFSLFQASCDDCYTTRDSASAIIIRQSPAAGNTAPAGSEITVWLTK